MVEWSWAIEVLKQVPALGLFAFLAVRYWKREGSRDKAFKVIMDSCHAQAKTIQTSYEKTVELSTEALVRVARREGESTAILKQIVRNQDKVYDVYEKAFAASQRLAAGNQH